MSEYDQDDVSVKFSDFYTFEAVLGSGGFGRVVQASNLQNEQVAVKVHFPISNKIIPKREYKTKDLSKILAEASILSRLKNPNIVEFRAVRETDTKILIEMALVRHGQLKQFITKPLTLEQKRQIMVGIFRAVEYIHSHGVVHRDLKPEVKNILIEDPENLGSLKIVDFGLSTQQSLLLSGQCGTLIYMAPELFTSKVYSKPVDIWSCGIILHMVCCGGQHPLYREKDTVESYKEKLMGLKWDLNENFDKMARNLFLKCVAEDPVHRYTASQALLHPWITGNQDDPVPLTMAEMYRSFSLREEFMRIIKGLMILRMLKKVKLDRDYLGKVTDFASQCQATSTDTMSTVQLLTQEQGLLEKEYVREMMAEHVKLKERQKQGNIEKPQPKYELILKRIKENQSQHNYHTQNNIQISEESSSIRNSQQSIGSYNKLINFNELENSSGQKGMHVGLKRQMTTKKKSKKITQVVSAKKHNSSVEVHIRSRSTTTNHRNNPQEVKHFDSPKKLSAQNQFLAPLQQYQTTGNITGAQNTASQNQQPTPSPNQQRKISFNYDCAKLSEIRQRNFSTRKISVVESEQPPDAYRFEQEKVVHNMFMPRGFSKKIPYQRGTQLRYMVPPQLIELNTIKQPKAESENREVNEFRIHDLGRTKPPLPSKKVAPLELLKKK